MFNFNWFRKTNSTEPEKNEEKNEVKNSEDVITDHKTTIPSWASLSKEIPPIPEINSASDSPKDHYRVGYDTEKGVTTLTLHTDTTSMTLFLVESEVMRLIRLLDATLDYEIGIADDEQDD